MNWLGKARRAVQIFPLALREVAFLEANMRNWLGEDFYMRFYHGNCIVMWYRAETTKYGDRGRLALANHFDSNPVWALLSAHGGKTSGLSAFLSAMISPKRLLNKALARQFICLINLWAFLNIN